MMMMMIWYLLLLLLAILNYPIDGLDWDATRHYQRRLVL
jgi:hypothetical protein